MMRTLCLMMLLAGTVQAGPPADGVLLVGECGPGEPARLILPPSWFDAVPAMTPPGSTWLPGVFLALAAVAFGWWALGRRVPRLATACVLVLVVILPFTGCWLAPEPEPIPTHYFLERYTPLQHLSDEVRGQLRIEHGIEEGPAVLLVPLDEVKKLTTP